MLLKSMIITVQGNSDSICRCKWLSVNSCNSLLSVRLHYVHKYLHNIPHICREVTQLKKLQNQFENLKMNFYLSSIYAAGGYLRVIPEWFHLIRNGNGHIWVGALGVNQIKSCNLTHGGENFYTGGGWGWGEKETIQEILHNRFCISCFL